MSLIISTASATSTLAFAIQARAASALRSVASLTGAPRPAGTSSLAQRLRYDLGELDIDPDRVRQPHRRHDALNREIMRRGF